MTDIPDNSNQLIQQEEVSFTSAISENTHNKMGGGVNYAINGLNGALARISILETQPVLSLSTGNFTANYNTGAVPGETLIVNADLTYISQGRPVIVTLVPDNSVNPADISVVNNFDAELRIKRDSVIIATFRIREGNYLPGAFELIDVVPAGTYNYQAFFFSANAVPGPQLNCRYVKLSARQD